MTRDPVLASKRFAAGEFQGERCPMVMLVHGGLHYMRGNSSPHFSLTYWAHRAGFPNQRESGGAGHDTILRYFPQFADLAALHLSDIDGAPMHAEANGWYKLAGALGGMGERYHVGNSDRHFPITPDPATPWRDTEYRKPTAAECLKIFAAHFRITLAEAEAFVASLELPHDNLTAAHAPRVRAALAGLVESLRPRWKAEAEACIKAHALVVYGDAWPAAA